MEAGTKKDSSSVLVRWEGRDASPTDNSDRKTNRVLRSIQHSKSGYGIGWYYAKASQAVPVSTIDKPCNNKSRFPSITERSSNTAGVSQIRPVNKLLVDAVDYQNYRVIEKLVRYGDAVSKKINQQPNKTALTVWLFKHSSNSLVESFNKVCVTLSTETAKVAEGRSMSYSTSANLLLKWYSMDDNIATVDANI